MFSSLCVMITISGTAPSSRVKLVLHSPAFLRFPTTQAAEGKNNDKNSY